MHPDSPIESSKDDRFERTKYSQNLASCLTLPKHAPSIVVGLEGQWGQGKTSCINIIRDQLKESPDQPIVVEYAPWLVSTLDSLVEGFFVELAAAVGSYSKGKKAQETAKKVLNFAKMLAPIKLIPGVEPWGSLVESVLNSVGGATQAGAEFSDLSLESRKKDLQSHLSKLNRPIVVFIDDIDRLPPHQVQTVFQMLKAVVDFPRVAYLVAYDPRPVAQALSFGSIYDGTAYLEKLVQISYPLPRLSFLHRKDYLVDQVTQLLASHKLELSETENELWFELLNDTYFVRLLSSPRSIVRLLNRLQLSILNLWGEVCFADVAAFEALELTFPKIAERIRREPELFVNSEPWDPEFWPSGFVQYRKTRALDKGDDGELLKSLLSEDVGTDLDLRARKSLLNFIFPKLVESENQLSSHSEGPNRIRGRVALLKLLYGGSNTSLRSSTTARRFLSTPNDRTTILADWMAEGTLVEWLEYIVNFLPHETIPDMGMLCEVLLKEARFIDNSISSQHVPNSLGGFLYKLLLVALPDSSTFTQLMQNVVQNPASLAASLRCLIFFLDDASIWKKGTLVPKAKWAKTEPEIVSDIPVDTLYDMIDLWIGTVRTSARDEELLLNQPNPLSVLYGWGCLNGEDFSEVSCYIEKHMSDVSWLRKFVSEYTLGKGFPKGFCPSGFSDALAEHFPDCTKANIMSKLALFSEAADTTALDGKTI